MALRPYGPGASSWETQIECSWHHTHLMTFFQNACFVLGSVQSAENQRGEDNRPSPQVSPPQVRPGADNH